MLRFSSILWYFFLFLAGASSTAVEVAGLRLLVPLWGSSLPVWGIIIATVLAGLAAGYRWGGIRARQPVVINTVLETAMLAGAWFTCMPLIIRLAENLLFIDSPQFDGLLTLASFVLSLFALFIPSVFFGMISPLAVQTEVSLDQRTAVQRTAGNAAGLISTLTTSGSIVGLLLPSILTIPLFGTRQTIWIFAGSLLIVSALYRWHYRQSIHQLAGLLLGLSLLEALWPSAKNTNIIWAQETPYQHVTVAAHGQRHELIYDAGYGIQSRYTPETYTDGYWDYMGALPLFFPPEQPDFSLAVIGAGASSTERQLHAFWQGYKRLAFTSVEIDKAVTDIAARFFYPPERHVVVADGRRFLRTNTEHYDVIAIDSYAQELTIPFHLATREFFQQVKQRLKPNGMVVLNTNALSADTLFIRSLARTANAVWPQVQMIDIPQACNFLILAADHPIKLQLPAADKRPGVLEPLLPTLSAAWTPRTDGILMTDNRAPTDILGLAALTIDTKNRSCQ